jgi:hypothetical protein
MLKTSILASVEPVSFSKGSAFSVASLNALSGNSQSLRLADASGRAIGTIIGLVPILQPFRISANGQDAIVRVMKSVAQPVDGGASLESGGSFSISGDRNGLMGSGVRADRDEAQSIHLLVLLAPELQASLAPVTASLGQFLSGLAAQHWAAEPIHHTTHQLHLAATGQLLSRAEMRQTGTTYALLSLDPDTTTLAAAAPGTIAVSNAGLSGAGKLVAPVADASGGSTGGSCQAMPSFGTDDSGSGEFSSIGGDSNGGDGDGGDGDGDGDGDGGDGDGGDGDGDGGDGC